MKNQKLKKLVLALVICSQLFTFIFAVGNMNNNNYVAISPTLFGKTGTTNN